MEATFANTDPMLERAVRLGTLMARLPALPTHDWLDRAATVVAKVVPASNVLALLTLPREGDIERLGAAGPQAAEMNRDPAALMRRIERLPRQAPGPLVQPAPKQFTTRLGGPFAEADICHLATAPLGDGQVRRLLVLVAADPAAQPAAVLQLAMPDLVARALAALGPDPDAGAQWLLPADLHLIEGLVAGKTIPEIARESDRKEHAVQDAIKAMYRRLGRNRRTDLVARAVGHVPACEIEGKGC